MLRTYHCAPCYAATAAWLRRCCLTSLVVAEPIYHSTSAVVAVLEGGRGAVAALSLRGRGVVAAPRRYQRCARCGSGAVAASHAPSPELHA